jgi:hypothetical protein
MSTNLVIETFSIVFDRKFFLFVLLVLMEEVSMGKIYDGFDRVFFRLWVFGCVEASMLSVKADSLQKGLILELFCNFFTNFPNNLATF